MIAQFEVLLNFFLELLKKMLCLKKNRKKACHAFYWRRLRRRKRGKKKRRVFPIIGHFGGLRKPKVVPACPQPTSQSSWPPGRGPIAETSLVLTIFLSPFSHVPSVEPPFCRTSEVLCLRDHTSSVVRWVPRVLA